MQVDSLGTYLDCLVKCTRIRMVIEVLMSVGIFVPAEVFMPAEVFASEDRIGQEIW